MQTLTAWQLRLGCKLPAPAHLAAVQSLASPDAQPQLVPAALLLERTIALQNTALTDALRQQLTGAAPCLASRAMVAAH